MSNKTPTPIQELINKFNELLEYSKTPDANIFDKHIITPCIETTIIMLTEQLPAERKLAEECFDAGCQSGVDSCNGTGSSEDFSTFYKNNYEDGK